MRVKGKFFVPCRLEVDKDGMIVGVYSDREWLADCVVISTDDQVVLCRGQLNISPVSEEAEGARKAYFAHKKEHPTGNEKLTGLQRRMQSGGA